MKRNILDEAVANATRISNAAMSNARTQLTEAFSTNLKVAVTEGMRDALSEEKDQPGDYHAKPEKKGFIGDRDGQSDESLNGIGDGPAKLEASVYEGDDEDEMDFDDVGSEDGDEEVLDDEEYYDDEEDFGDELEFDDNPSDEFEDDVMEMDDEDMSDGDDDDVEIDIDVDAEADDNDEDGVNDEDDDEDEDVFEVIEMDGEEEEMDSLKSENSKLKKENRQYNKALRYLTHKLDEVNLFNARLAYSTKLMRKVALTTEEKTKVVQRFDECESIKEVKRAYQMMNEVWSKNTSRKQRVRKNVQTVSTIKEGRETRNEQLNETAARWKELAGIIQS